MPFVKLDCGILNSTLWFERGAREVFITALLMAEPLEILEPMEQLQVRSLEGTGWRVPPGWYGFVEAAGVGIISRAGADREEGLQALETLGKADDESRSREFEGRRLVRVNGGFVVLNFMKYRERDYTSAERSRRYRLRKASRRDITPSRRDITQAEAEAEAEERSKADKPTAPAVAPVASFELRGGRTFLVTPDGISRFSASYPGINVPAELLKAEAWIRANPTRRKTARGMPRFLAGWFNRCDGAPAAKGVEVELEDWFADCKAKHGGTCNGRMAHAIQVDIDAEKGATT